MSQHLFEPVYSLEVVAELSGLSAKTILRYQEEGLIRPMTRPQPAAFLMMKRCARSAASNLPGLKLVLSLLEEIERLQAWLRPGR